MTTSTGTPRDSKPGLAMAAMSLSLHPTPNALSSSLQRVVQHLLDRPLVQQHQTKESSRAAVMDHAEVLPIQALPQLPRGSPHAEPVSEPMLLPLKSTVNLTACRRRRNAAMGSGVSMAVSMSTGGLEGTRRSRLRRLLNDIIRKHNDVVPPGSDTTEPRFDAEHLPPPPPAQLPGGRRIVLPAADQKHVLILMSDTGGGHRASAEALKATFELEYGNKYLVTIVDLWKEHTPWPFNQMPKSYSFMVKHEALWKVAFHATKPRFVHQPQMAATAAFVAREVSKALDMYRPDVIVSVHPLMQHIPLRVLRSRGLLDRIPFTTVITDLTTCHPTWFHKLVTLCFCPTEEVAQRAMKAGLQQSQLRVHGLPIRPAFAKPTGPQEELRKELGMDPHLPAALLIGGGEGMGPVEATARALAQSLGAAPSDQGEDAGAGGGSKAKGQLVVVCGRNKKLREKLEKIDWPMPTLVKGFVTNMPDVMAACDCIITKAGPGTIAESLIRGLPMVLNGFIAGQEAGNVPFVVDNGAGKFCDKPAEIAKIVANWFGDGAEEFQQMSVNARRLARPEAVFKIVRDLDGLVCKNDLLKSVQSQQQEQQPAQVAIVQ